MWSWTGTSGTSGTSPAAKIRPGPGVRPSPSSFAISSRRRIHWRPTTNSSWVASSSTFTTTPLLPVPGDEPRDSHGGASTEIRVVPETPSLEHLTQLWNALNEPFRLSVILLVEVVAIDSGLPPRATPRVGSFHTLVGTGETP